MLLFCLYIQTLHKKFSEHCEKIHYLIYKELYGHNIQKLSASQNTTQAFR